VLQLVSDPDRVQFVRAKKAQVHLRTACVLHAKTLQSLMGNPFDPGVGRSPNYYWYYYCYHYWYALFSGEDWVVDKPATFLDSKRVPLLPSQMEGDASTP
jgi:hypothetical protein